MSGGSRAVAIARSWLGTPFMEGASVRGVGADCVGLMEGIARELGVTYPTRHDARHDLLVAVSASLVQIQTPEFGALILLSRAPGGPPVHGALVSDTGTLIHAHWQAGIIENRFGSWFVRRMTHIFAWPETATPKDN